MPGMGETVAGILFGAAIIGALFVIGRGVAWFVGVLRKFARLVDALTGEPPGPGLPLGRPGFLDRLTSIEDRQTDANTTLAALEARLAAVEAQLQPNGGGSLRDAVDRIAPPDGAVTAAAALAGG